MPLSITIPAKDLYDPVKEKFLSVKETTLTLEHSLISLSKWEMKWHKPYLTAEQKTPEEYIDYIRCMCLTKNVEPYVFYALDGDAIKKITDYISDPMTATTFKNQKKGAPKKIITNEVIYFWMSNFGIPFDPCEKWHLNRLMTLIEVASIENQPPKKMSKADILRNNHSLNAARRAKHHTKG